MYTPIKKTKNPQFKGFLLAFILMPVNTLSLEQPTSNDISSPPYSQGELQNSANPQLINDNWLNSVKNLLELKGLADPPYISKNIAILENVSPTKALPPPLTGEKLVTAASNALINKNLLKAEKLYNLLRSPYENPLMGEYGLALVYSQQGKFAQSHDMLEKIVNEHPQNFPLAQGVKNELALILAEQAQNKQNFQQAEIWLRSFLKTQQNNKLTQYFNRLMRRQAKYNGKLPDKYTNRPPLRVGVLLPLSGDLKNIGGNMLKAMEIAMFDHAPENIIIYPHDTEGTPKGAKNATIRAIGDGSDILIGPLLSPNVAEAANISKNKGIPVISFSSDPTVAQKNVYLVGLLGRQQAEEIARYAAGLGKKKTAVLIPDDSYSHEIFNFFRIEFQKLGGEIVAYSYYDPLSNDHKKALEKILNMGAAKKLLKEQQLQLEQEYSLLGDAMDDQSLQQLKDIKTAKPQPIIEFDSLFIPSSSHNLPLIASQLAFYDIDPQNITFLGTSRWHNKEILANRAEYLRGALFTSQPNYKLEKFQRRLKRQYNQEASKLDSLAYDAVSIICELYKYTPHNKNTIFSQLTRKEGFRGVSGAFKLLENGKNERQYDILRISSRGFITEQKAPEASPPSLPKDITNTDKTSKNSGFFSFW